MKNKVSYLLFFMVAVLAAAGCKKSFLEDMKSYEKFDEDMFTSEVLTGAYIDRLYNYYFVAYTSPMKSLVGSWESTRGQSTDELGGTMTNFIHPTRNLQLASESDGYIGAALEAKLVNAPYTRIRFANFLIEKIDGGVGQVLREDFRKTAKGQMYFMRALQYFDLLRVFGGVPLVLTVQNASSTDESTKLPRAKSSEVVDQIIKDLDSAVALLPKAWNKTTDLGRLNAPAAMAMKSRVLLTAASPLFNANWDNPGDQKWQRALDASLAAETYLTDAGFGKNLTNSAKDWSEVTFKEKDAFNGEGILVIPLSNQISSTGDNNGWENSIRLKDYKGNGGISVPKGMIDLFPMSDGSRPVIGANYDDFLFFKNRDPRFYRTFFFSGEKWPTKGTPNSRTTWLYRYRKTAGGAATYAVTDNSALLSPVVVKKMSDPTADSTVFSQSGTDIFDFRYGELLLNIAECYAAQGKTAQCATYLSKVRQRVYPQSASGNNYGIGVLADRYSALEACLYERRVELAYEGKRFWDLQRWMLYDDDAAIGDNTNALLNIAKLNGTTRTGYLWEAQAVSPSDPMSAADKVILVDPDAADFSIQIDTLAARVSRKFKMVPTDQPMDKDGTSTTPLNTLFRSNYYIMGLTGTVLGVDPWLTQTKGWLDFNGAPGTYDYRD